jgi:hypothetical protein
MFAISSNEQSQDCFKMSISVPQIARGEQRIHDIITEVEETNGPCTSDDKCTGRQKELDWLIKKNRTKKRHDKQSIFWCNFKLFAVFLKKIYFHAVLQNAPGILRKMDTTNCPCCSTSKKIKTKGLFVFVPYFCFFVTFVLKVVKADKQCCTFFRLRSKSGKETHAKGVLCVPASQLLVKDVEGKGKGLLTLRSIWKHDFVCEYRGKLISAEEVGGKGGKWPPNLNEWTAEGCFSYFFRTLDGCRWCLDAMHSGGPGRMINHDDMHFNLTTKVVEEEGKAPRLFFQAIRDIEKGEELSYDYGETDEEVIAANQWLRSNKKMTSK